MNHTFSPRWLTRIPTGQVREELERNEQWIAATFATSSRPYWYRPLRYEGLGDQSPGAGDASRRRRTTALVQPLDEVSRPRASSSGFVELGLRPGSGDGAKRTLHVRVCPDAERGKNVNAR